MVLPPNKIAQSFSHTIQQWAQIITHNVVETRKLAEIRDYLLPKLLKGEIAV